MAEDNSDRATMAMELAKRQLIDVMWKTATPTPRRYSMDGRQRT